MAQHDYTIDNQSFPATRTDINNVLLAISSTNSGATAPSTTYASQLWYDTSENKLYIRNEDNDAWIPLFLLDQSNDKAGTLATEIDVEDASGTDTAGTALTIKGGAGTGTGAGGSIIFQTADGAGSTGSSVNAHATQVTITDDGNVGIGTATTTDAGVVITKSVTRAGSWDAKLALQSTGASDFPALLFTNSDTTQYGGIVGTTDTSGDDGNNQTAQIQLLQTSATEGNIAFRTNGNIGTTSTTERMRITSDGDLFIGRTSGQPTTSAFGTLIKGSGHSFISRDVNGGSSTLRVFGNAGEGRIMGDGDLQNTNNNYGAISDETLKQDIVDAASQWDDIKDIRVRKFRLKDNPEGALQIGVIAQELEASGMNGLVKEVMSNDEDEDSEETVKTVKYSILYMKAVKALQEAMERIETLETKVAALEG